MSCCCGSCADTNESTRGCYAVEPSGCLEDANPFYSPDAYTFTGSGFADPRLNATFRLWGRAIAACNGCEAFDGPNCGACSYCRQWAFINSTCNIAIYLQYYSAAQCDLVTLVIETATDTYNFTSAGIIAPGGFHCQAGGSVTLPFFSQPRGSGAHPASVTVGVAADAAFCGGCCTPAAPTTVTGTVTVTAGSCAGLNGKTFTLAYNTNVTVGTTCNPTSWGSFIGWTGSLTCGGATTNFTLACKGGGTGGGYCLDDDQGIFNLGGFPNSFTCSPFRLEWDNLPVNFNYCGCDGTVRVKIVLTP